MLRRCCCGAHVCGSSDRSPGWPRSRLAPSARGRGSGASAPARRGAASQTARSRSPQARSRSPAARSHLGRGLEVDGLETSAPYAPRRVVVDQRELVLLEEGLEGVGRERLAQVGVSRLGLVVREDGGVDDRGGLRAIRDRCVSDSIGMRRETDTTAVEPRHLLGSLRRARRVLRLARGGGGDVLEQTLRRRETRGGVPRGKRWWRSLAAGLGGARSRGAPGASRAAT